MTLKSRLARLENKRQERERRDDDSNRPLTFAEALGAPRGSTLTATKILLLVDRAGPLPTHPPANAIDVEAEVQKAIAAAGSAVQ
ncbi:MAG TPA: hypothetical protein VMV10_08200 [Pirellulales bacterium]|nr:hypothetical protein [Pirellulales bacterium]